jgi:rSAM/selenodomain-associated transferase 1
MAVDGVPPAGDLESSRFLVQVFAKAPVPGEVKTRLIDSLGVHAATRLHCRLVHRTLASVARARLGAAEIWTTEPGAAAFASGCGEALDLPVHMQGDGDLGARMSRAIADGLRRARYAILVGTDVPSLRPEDLLEASQALERGCDAVLGPAEDGGYYLIGAARHHAALFAHIPWSEASVMERTRNRLRALGWRWHELAVRWDVDRPQDCERITRDPDLAALMADLETSG